MSKQRYLITPALPYANGDAHLGHLVEHLQVNTYVRALRMAGEDVLYVCGIDSHGAGIEIAATKAGLDPADYTLEVRRRQEASFEKFLVAFDGGYGTTHTSENERHAGRIWSALKDAGHITTKEVEQLQDPKDGRFLADRFVKGTCPKCGTKDQYGDSCESCNSTYRATELIDPVSVISGLTPTMGKSIHYMVTLGAYAERLKAYLDDEVLHPSLRNFLNTWFADGLKDWDVSRDGPYFGFKIPGEDNKYFYVWLDAPVGYVSLTERALDAGPMSHNIVGAGGLGRSTLTSAYDATKNSTWEDYWKDPSTRIEHFIGKDILYFHTLFWPAMGMAAGQTLPSRIRVHGMLTVDGVKMSKSRGTFINADDFAAVCQPEALRYYFATKMTAEPQDIDLSFEDFVNRVNADLVNNLVNLVSRTVPLLQRFFEGKPSTLPEDQSELIHEVHEQAAHVDKLYRDLDTAGVVRAVTELGSRANKLLQDRAPWALVRTNAAGAHGVLTTALWVGKTCLALLKPVLPVVVKRLESLLRVEPFTFQNAADPLPLTKISPYEHLFSRVEIAGLQKLIVKDVADWIALRMYIDNLNQVEVEAKSGGTILQESVSQHLARKNTPGKKSIKKYENVFEKPFPAHLIAGNCEEDSESGSETKIDGLQQAAVVRPTKVPKSKEPAATKVPKSTDPAPPPAEVAIDDFKKVDLRAAKVLSAKAVDGSDKLIHVVVDVGVMGQREIFTGLRPHVQPEQLQDRTLVVVVNLAPRKMAKFGMSHGMILAVGDIPAPLFIDGATPGDRVS